MKIVEEWKWIARRAWSVRFAALASVSAVADVVVPLAAEDVPHRIFVLLSAVSALLSVAARFVAQDHGDR